MCCECNTKDAVFYDATKTVLAKTEMHCVRFHPLLRDHKTAHVFPSQNKTMHVPILIFVKLLILTV